MKKLSIVIPFLNEADNLKNAKEKLKVLDDLFSKSNCSLEYIFVDDGSTDDSVKILLEAAIPNSKIISLSKNFGTHYAVLSAIDNANSDFLTVMGADFQEPSDLFIRMFEKLESTGADILFGQRENRVTDLFSKIFSKIYNYLLRKIVFSDYPENGGDIFMISRKVMNVFKASPEKNTSVIAFLFTLGFQKEYISYKQLERTIGKSKWTLKKKIKLFTDTFVSFTILPLRLITITGVIVSLSGFAFGLSIVVYYLMGWIKTPGYSTIVALITFGFGSVFLMLGIISEYLWRMFDQIRPRPRYIIREKYGFEDFSEGEN